MGHTREVSRSVIDDICHRLKWIEEAIYRLQNKKRRSIPIYEKARLPNNLPNGLLFFTDDTFQFGLVLDDTIYYANVEETSL
jgi:hypothetical protein